jgi:hypothetical protein
MFRFFTIVVSLCCGASCAAMGFTSSRDTLIRTAAFDHDCPPEKIVVLAEQEDGVGAASFKLDVCGTKRAYKRMGTLYQDASKPIPGMPN